jgi:hypothetical protein
MATTILQRVAGMPAESGTHRVSLADRRAWTFRARSFAARTFIAPLTARRPIGGTTTVRVSN